MIHAHRELIKGQYIVVLKQNSTTTTSTAGAETSQSENTRFREVAEVRAMAEESRNKGAEILNIFQHAVNGYAIRTTENENTTTLTPIHGKRGLCLE